MASIAQFAQEASIWLCRYQNSRFKEYVALEERTRSKAARLGHLDIDDLVAIAVWGGNQYGIAARVKRYNSGAEVVQTATRAALENLYNPPVALGSLLELKHWGLTYASKTLMFMCPSAYVALDSKIRESTKSLLPRIYDGPAHRDSMIRGYQKFLELCQRIQLQVTAPGPRAGRWFIADIESALFQFAYEGNVLRQD